MRVEKNMPGSAVLGSQAGYGLVLVVDDEEAIRDIASTCLQKEGFDVIMATDGFEALRVFETYADDIQLVLLDMKMPRLNGDKTAKQIYSMCPHMPILFSSGYSRDVFENVLCQHRNVAFIQKPYRYKELVGSVLQLLDESMQGVVSRDLR